MLHAATARAGGAWRSVGSNQAQFRPKLAGLDAAHVSVHTSSASPRFLVFGGIEPAPTYTDHAIFKNGRW